MLLRSLEAFAVPPQLLQVWEDALGSELLPVQEQAVTRYGVLAGENLIVQAPTSSGKTFIGEMAAARAAMAGKRVLYLAPTKALAEEKHAQFQALYQPLGLRVIISTRDRRHDDSRLGRGDFHVAVAVPEKVRAIWARSGGGFGGLGLVVVDELQTLGDPRRGACLEMLLSAFRQTPGLQIIGLSACLGTSPKLAEYLRAGWLETRERPVELRQGVLIGGSFRYLEYNSGRAGEEDFAAAAAAGDNYAEAAARLASVLVKRGEPTLVFVRDRGSARALAWRLARDGDEWEEGEEEGCRGERPEPWALEQTAAREQLARLMACGVAFHSTDLQFEDRRAVEAAFRRGEVMALCATPTLALGVNLPTRNVIIDPCGWQSEGLGGPSALGPISRAEYENRAGRAGRLGSGGFGRAFLLADSPLTEAALAARYLRGDLEPPRPVLGELEPLDAVLNLATLSSPLRQSDLHEAYSRTFSAYCAGESRLPGRLAQAAEVCEERRLLRRLEGSNRLVTTALGKVAASCGVSFDTFAWLQRWAGAATPPTALEATYLCLLTPEAVADWAPPFYLGSRTDFGAQLAAYAEDVGERGQLLAELLACGDRERNQRQQAARQAMVLERWIGGEETRVLEEELRAPAARLEALGEAVGWLVGALAEIGAETGWPLAQSERLRTHGERLALGLPTEGLALGRLRVPGLGRDGVRRLVAAGYDTPRALAEAEAESVAGIVGPGLAETALAMVRRARRGEARESVMATARATVGPARREPAGQPAGLAVLVLDEGRPDEALFYGRKVALRPAEFRMLRALAECAGKCVRYDALYDRMWNGDTFVEPGQIYSHRSRLSAKLAEAVPDRDTKGVLVTVPRHGLRLNLEPAEVRIAS